jgi:hypothetical protein
MGPSKQAMKSSLPFLTVVSALTVIPAVASAQDQPWLKDRRFAEGAGFRVGDFELHPGASAEFGYDSNFFRRADNEDPIGALRLRVTPSFSVSTLGQQRREGVNTPSPDVEFRGGISATYNEFFGITGGTGGKSLMNGQRNVGGLLDLNLNILPGRPWSGVLTAGFARAITASDQGITSESFNRDVPSGSAELVWTPGAGLFSWRLGYAFTGTIFEAASYSKLTNLVNTVTTRGSWRFLPRTALVYDARFGFIIYPNPRADVKTGSHPMRAQLGVNGLITPSFGITVMAGWGASFYTPNTATDPKEDFDSVIGQLEVKWYITPNVSTGSSSAPTTSSALAVGFTRDFYDSFIGTYFERDRGYLNFSYFFGGKALLVLDAGAGPVIYPKFNIGTQQFQSFTNVRIDASAFAEYRFKDFLGANITLRYNQNVGNTTITVPGGGADYLAYKQFEAYLGFRWFM